MVDLTEGAYTERELMMIKVRAVGKEREEMKRMADIFRGRIIDVTEKSYTIEVTGDQAKNDAFLSAIDRSAILETVRTGASGIGRGERILRVYCAGVTGCDAMPARRWGWCCCWWGLCWWWPGCRRTTLIAVCPRTFSHSSACVMASLASPTKTLRGAPTPG